MNNAPILRPLTAAQLRDLRMTNAKNKRTIQAKRAKFASTKATLEGMQHPGKFPTKYKYG